MASSDSPRLPLSRYQWTALAVFVLASGACALGFLLNSSRFFQSYLLAFIYWWTAAMGCLGLGLLYQMTGGRWGYAARPFFDAGIRTLPLLAVAFLPIALGLDWIYAWTQEGFFAGNEHAENRSWYLSEGFFLGRAVFYFAVAILLGFVLTRRTIDRKQSRPVQGGWPLAGGLGAVAATLVVTFAMFDWGMSLDTEWYSTMYGSIFIAGGLMSALCLVTAGVALSVERLGRHDKITRTVLHDLGKLTLAFLMVWAYLAFSQFLIIYAGNLPVEAVYYTDRLQGGWESVAVALVVLHFVVPFFCLLSHDLKRSTLSLAWVTLGLAAVHLLETYWTIIPSFHRGSFSLHWLDFAAPLALGGLLAFEFLRQLKLRLVPVLDHWPHDRVSVNREQE